jgi:hypothetical protein
MAAGDGVREVMKMAINYANIYDTMKLAQSLRQIDVLREFITFFPIPGGEAVREIQFDFLNAPDAVKITDDYEFVASRAELYSANRHQFLCTTEIEMNVRDFRLQTGNEGQLPAHSISKFAYMHQPHRAEYVLMGDAEFPDVEGCVAASGSDTLQKPSSCESTPGTAETPGGIYTDIVDAMPLGGAAALDLRTALVQFAKQEMLYENRDNDIVLLMHPIAHAILQGTNTVKIAGTTTAATEAVRENPITYFKEQGVRIYQFKCIDSDYAGADAGTTQFVFLANPKKSLFAGIGKSLTVEPWWDNEDHTAKRSRIAEALVPTVLPPYKDSSDDYFKPVVHITTTPFS